MIQDLEINSTFTVLEAANFNHSITLMVNFAIEKDSTTTKRSLTSSLCLLASLASSKLKADHLLRKQWLKSTASNLIHDLTRSSPVLLKEPSITSFSDVGTKSETSQQELEVDMDLTLVVNSRTLASPQLCTYSESLNYQKTWVQSSSQTLGQVIGLSTTQSTGSEITKNRNQLLGFKN